MNNRTFVRPALLALATLLFAVALHAAPARPSPAVTWIFSTREDTQLVPHTKVFLKIGAKSVLIQPDAQCQFHAVPPGAYASYDVPASALAACQGWFAGGGENLFVVRHGLWLRVYQRDLDEQSPTEPYRLIRSIPLTK